MRNVYVLGPGCAKCKKLAGNVREALKKVEGEFDYDYITDIQKITEYGIMMTPGLVIDGKVKSSGKVLSVEDIVEMLKS